MRIAMLLGSGSSVPAGMPTVGAITRHVLTGNNVTWTGSLYRVVDELPPNHDIFAQQLPEVVSFVSDLNDLALGRFS